MLLIIIIVAVFVHYIIKSIYYKNFFMEGMTNSKDDKDAKDEKNEKHDKDDKDNKDEKSILDIFISTASKLTNSLSSKKEGFKNSLNPTDLDYVSGDSYTMSSWVDSAKNYAKGVGNTDHLNSYQYNTGTPIPLPEGELFLFAQNKFSPKCCPSTYTSSSGCACISQDQYNFLVTRGNNRNFPTEY